MISMDKKYRTRDGREVRIYAVDGTHPRQIHGAILDRGAWLVWTWHENGRSGYLTEELCDLIETKPRIKRTVWLNIYESETYGPYTTKTQADRLANEKIQACIKVEINCEEGEGL